MPINLQILNKYAQLTKYTLLLPLLLGSMTLQAAGSCTSLYEKHDFKSALEKCSVEAELNALNAHYILGQLYIKGLGTPKNVDKGISYYRQAVLNNDVDSQIALGKYHAENKNYLQSHMFFSLAIDNGSLSALKFKDNAAQNLSSNDLEVSKEYLNLVKHAIAQQRKQLANN